MRKNTLIIILSLALSVFLISGCEDSNGSGDINDSDKPNVEENEDKDEVKDPEPEDDGSIKVSSYYPIRKNVKYTYKGNGNEFAAYDRYTSYTDGGKVQYREENAGTVLAEIIEIEDGKVTRLLSRGEAYYQENLLRDDVMENLDTSETEVLLQEPIEEGNAWELSDGSERKITNLEALVNIPMGQYKALEVTTKGLDDSVSIDYYVEDIGLIKSVFKSEGMNITSTLKSIEEDAKITQEVKFFYPDIDDERLHYKEIDVDFKTDDIARVTLEKLYKNTLEDEDSVVLTKNTKINYLYLNYDGMVYIDLSKEFLSEMNAGSGYEGKILESLAATFGTYYGADRVVLTIDGGDYESGHIVLGPEDYIEFNSEDAVGK